MPLNRQLHLRNRDRDINKIPVARSPLQAAQKRIEWVMDNFPRLCVSFSGSKDSTLMLHPTALHARRTGRKINVLFIDWEAQFSCTITHCEALREAYQDVIEQFWVALPLTTQNSLSQFTPEWQCWQPDARWVRQPPPHAITDPGYFSLCPGDELRKLCSRIRRLVCRERPLRSLSWRIRRG